MAFSITSVGGFWRAGSFTGAPAPKPARQSQSFQTALRQSFEAAAAAEPQAAFSAQQLTQPEAVVSAEPAKVAFASAQTATTNATAVVGAYKLYREMTAIVKSVMKQFPDVYRQEGHPEWQRLQGSMVDTAMAAVASRVPGSGVSLGVASISDLAGTPVGALVEALLQRGMVSVEDTGLGGGQVIGMGGVALSSSERASLTASANGASATAA